MEVSTNSKASINLKADYEWSVALNRACLKAYGVWPEDESKHKKWILNTRVILILIVMIFSTIIPTLHSLARIWGNLTSMIDNLPISLPLLMSMLKIVLLWWKKKELVPIMKMIKEDWLKSKTEEERNVMMKKARITRIITIFGYIMTLLFVLLMPILLLFGIPMRDVTNITDPGKLLPLQTYYMYDTDRSPVYEITFILQCITLTSASFIYTGTDNFLGFLVFHMCGQLENLRSRILRLDRNNFETSLSYNVEDHKRLIRSIKIVDNIFTLMMLGLLIYFSIIFALYGFLFVTIVSQGSGLSIARFGFMILAFIILFTYMSFYCILGEILAIQGEGVHDAIYEYKWYKLEPKKARNLLMIMISANKPLWLTAGKLFPMTMSTLCSLLKTSCGYISFLMTQRE